jgi:hypothetical protein
MNGCRSNAGLQAQEVTSDTAARESIPRTHAPFPFEPLVMAHLADMSVVLLQLG